MTSAFVNAAFAPQMAVPATVIYEARPALMQVKPKELARELLTKKQYGCLTKLLGKESAWNPAAKNPKSSAKGIGQLLDATYRNLGMKHSQVGAAQLVATLAYIGRKYGSGGPCAAWDHFQRKNWY